MKRKQGSTNRLLCAVAYWFWESHASWPHPVTHVFAWNEYRTTHGHCWIEHYQFWRTIWRATGMVFPACKKVWDRIEQRIWEPRVAKNEFQHGM